MSLDEALDKAEEYGLDLVEVNPKANPPVCKIVDYGKFKYIKKKREHQAKKRQKQVIQKEMMFRPKTDEHDYQFKVKHIKKFLENGNKVKVTVKFRGRELAFENKGREILERIKNELADISKVEKEPVMENRRMVMILVPKR